MFGCFLNMQVWIVFLECRYGVPKGGGAMNGDRSTVEITECLKSGIVLSCNDLFVDCGDGDCKDDVAFSVRSYREIGGNDISFAFK